MKRLALAFAVVLAVAVAAWLLWRSKETPTTATSTGEGAAPSASEGTPAWVEPEPGAPPDRMYAYDAPSRPPDDAGPRLDRQKRDAMRDLIYRAWRQAPPEGAPITAAPAGARTLDKAYIRSRIREDYMPLAKDCYEQGLKKNPRLAGKIVAEFSIVGNKNVGGIIDKVDYDKDRTTLGDPDVLECLKQSLYSVTFDPPPDDGMVTVTYPIDFSPDDPDAGDGG